MHYVATFVVPYLHTIKVSVDAKNEDEAGEVASREFCAGDIYRADSPCAVVSDTYEEDGSSGADIGPTVEQVEQPPQPDASVRREEGAAAARRCVEALTRAYTNGAENGGSIDWSEVDEAHQHAVEALRLLAG